MNHNYIKVIACVLLSFSGYSIAIAQSPDPEFIDCSTTPDTLCVEDEGVRLPANNQFFLGEEAPEATSCSVHVTQKKRVRSHCGSTLQYEVLLFIHDTSSVYILKSVSTVTTDSLGEAELTFNTEEAVDSIIRTNGLPYGTDCSTPHLIKWVVLDSCGGFSVCEQRIHLFDCQAPVISNDPEDLITIHIQAWGLHLYAKDYIYGILDDCNPEADFLYSFSETWHQPDSVMDPCELPGFGIELPLDIWIADAGNDLNCDGQIVWQERNIYKQTISVVYVDLVGIDCWPEPTILHGDIYTEQSQRIKDVAVTLTSPGQVYPTFITTQDGQYYFHVESINGEATISAARNDFHRNGVSTLDLVKIQKHLLGREDLGSPYQIIAADANNSQNVSAIDLVILRKLILGIYTEFPDNKSWRFVPASYVFEDPMNPWYNTTIPWTSSSTITLTDLNNLGNLDFVGIKIGDVNNTVKADVSKLLPRETLPTLEFKTDQQSFQTGDVIEVDFRMPSDQRLTGFQFTVAKTGMEILDIIPGKILVSDEHYAILDDKLTISWFDVNDIAVTKDEVLFTLQLRAKKTGTLKHSLSINSDISAAEIYLDGEQTFLPVLNFQHQEERPLEIISCSPNPWKDKTTIQFYLPESDIVSVALFDATGRRIQTTSKFLPKGYHQHQISASDFSNRGLVFVEISTPECKVFQKMIMVE